MFLDDINAEHRSEILLKEDKNAKISLQYNVPRKINLFVQWLRMVGK